MQRQGVDRASAGFLRRLWVKDVGERGGLYCLDRPCVLGGGGGYCWPRGGCLRRSREIVLFPVCSRDGRVAGSFSLELGILCAAGGLAGPGLLLGGPVAY